MNSPGATPGTGQRATVSYSEMRWVWGLFIVLAYFPLFLDLDVLPVRVWDEARLGVSAYEMLQNHHFLVPYFDGAPDMWSTKPPFLIWCQALLFKLLGPGELALRLPSATCAFLVGLLIVYSATHWLRKPWLGLIAALILYTSQGYIYVSMHVARSGDYDSMLTMFMFLAALSLYRYERMRSGRALLFFFLAFTLAILTKSIQGLLIVPGCAAYLLLTGSWKDFIRDRRTWICAGGLILVVGGYYLGREALNPGYLNAVWNNELGGRYGAALENHKGAWDYFIQQFLQTNFTYWYLLVPCGIALGFSYKEADMRRWVLLLTCIGASYLIAVSSSATKCAWYDAPMYPILASLCAIPLYALFDWLRSSGPANVHLRSNSLPFVALFLAFATPYSTVVNHIYKMRELPSEVEYYEPLHYLHDAVKGTRELKPNVYCYEDYNGPMLFYSNALLEQGHPFRGVPKEELTAGMRVLANEWQVKSYIEAHYTYQVIDSLGQVNIYEIRGHADAEP